MDDDRRRRIEAALPAYEVGEEIGRGAWGVVLGGRHRHLDRDVAVKVLTAGREEAGMVERFRVEARMLASFDHPHIVPVFDFVEVDGLCLLVMERLRGGTLADRRRAGGLDARRACAIALAAAAGLEYAHRQGVLHRDVKPENVLFTGTRSSGDETVKVADFGIARVVGGGAARATATGVVLGTPAFMAPEQALGDELGPDTDVYALATVLYELLSGRLPFDVDEPAVTVLYQRAHGDPAPLGDVAPTLPAGLRSLVDASLSRDRAARPPSAAAFGNDLAAVAAAAWGGDWLDASHLTVHTGGVLGTPRRGAAAATAAAPVATPVAAPATAPAPAPAPGRARRRRVPVLPGVVVLGLAAIVAVVAVVLAGGDEPGGGSAIPTAEAAEAVARDVYASWVAGDRGAAEALLPDLVVERLFALAAEDELTFDNCDDTSQGLRSCAFVDANGDGRLIVEVARVDGRVTATDAGPPS